MNFLKRITTVLFFTSMAVLPSAQSALNDFDRQELSFQNLLAPHNSGFESGRAKFIASGGTFTAVTSGTNLLVGKGSATWDSNGASQTLLSQAVTVPNGLFGRNCEASIVTQTPSGTATHLVQAWNGSSVLVSSVIVSSTFPRQQTVTFPCPTSGTFALRLISVVADEPLIALDEGYLGIARNVGTVAQAIHKGSIRMTGCTDWSRSNTSFGSFTATAGCSYVATGDVLSPSTFIPGFRLQNVGPGRYLIFMRGSVHKSVTTTNSDAFLRFSDGTNTFSEQAVAGPASASGQSITGAGQISGGVTYSTAQTTLTFQLEGKVTNTTSSTSINISDDGGTNASGSYTEGLQFDVYYFPTNQQSVVMPNAQGLSWSGLHAGDCSWTTTSAAFVSPSADASCSFSQRTNRNFGTVTTEGSSLPGIIFTPRVTGTYFICATAHGYNSLASGYVAFALRNSTTSTNVATAGRRMAGSSGTNDEVPMTMCGLTVISSAASTTITIQMVASSGTSTMGTSSSANTIEWSIFNADQPTQAILANSVSTTATNGEKIESLRVDATCSASPCTIASQSGGFTDVTRAAAGNYTVNYPASTWSAGPRCVASAGDANTLAACKINSTATTTSVVIFCPNTSTGAGLDSDFNLICIGPR